MALQKSKTLPNGATGNYWKIIYIGVDKRSLRVNYQIDLYMDIAHSGIASLNYTKNYSFMMTNQQMAGDLTSLGYTKIKDFANTIKRPAVAYVAPQAAVEATYDSEGNELTPYIPAVAEVLAQPAVYNDQDLQGAIDV